VNLSVLVLHNVSPDMFFRYDPETSILFHAHEFQVVADNIEKAADVIWTLTNVDDGNHLRSMRSDLGLYAAQVDEYRERRNRSLSVGDVLVFTELPNRAAGALWVDNLGFKQVSEVAYDGGGSNQTAQSMSYQAHLLRAANPASRLHVSGGTKAFG
jgi:hypothetical protein